MIFPVDERRLLLNEALRRTHIVPMACGRTSDRSIRAVLGFGVYELVWRVYKRERMPDKFQRRRKGK
jgi:hypothetical protein